MFKDVIEIVDERDEAVKTVKRRDMKIRELENQNVTLLERNERLSNDLFYLEQQRDAANYLKIDELARQNNDLSNDVRALDTDNATLEQHRDAANDLARELEQERDSERAMRIVFEEAAKSHADRVTQLEQEKAKYKTWLESREINVNNLRDMNERQADMLRQVQIETEKLRNIVF